MHVHSQTAGPRTRLRRRLEVLSGRVVSRCSSRDERGRPKGRYGHDPLDDVRALVAHRKEFQQFQDPIYGGVLAMPAQFLAAEGVDGRLDVVLRRDVCLTFEGACPAVTIDRLRPVFTCNPRAKEGRRLAWGSASLHKASLPHPYESAYRVSGRHFRAHRSAIDPDAFRRTRSALIARPHCVSARYRAQLRKLHQPPRSPRKPSDGRRVRSRKRRARLDFADPYRPSKRAS